MKFKVREGFVALIVTFIELGDGSPPQRQENQYYGGQVVDLDLTQAREHAHKLEPLDKEATKFLASLELPKSESDAAKVSEDQLALVRAMASEMVAQLVPVLIQSAQAQAVQASAPAGA